MLVLDFINVGNGDSILVREMEGNDCVFPCWWTAATTAWSGTTTHRWRTPAPAGSLPGISCEVKVWRIWISCWSPTSTGTTSVVWAGCWRPSLWASC